MEAGYDYLLRRGRLQRKFFRYTGIIIFVFGALLLATGGAYYGYAAKARADLDNLSVALAGAVPWQRDTSRGPLTATHFGCPVCSWSARARSCGATSSSTQPIIRTSPE